MIVLILASNNFFSPYAPFKLISKFSLEQSVKSMTSIPLQMSILNLTKFFIPLQVMVLSLLQLEIDTDCN